MANKITRKKVVEYAEKCSAPQTGEYGRCETCKHYQHLSTCGTCYGSSRYTFDWQCFYESNKTEIDSYMEE